MSKSEKNKAKKAEIQMIKKRTALLLEEKKNAVRVESKKEKRFKNIFSPNILSNGFIDFKKVFENKVFINTKNEETNNQKTAVTEIEANLIIDNKSKTNKNVKNLDPKNAEDSTTAGRVLKMEICSGAGEWAMSQVTDLRERSC